MSDDRTPAAPATGAKGRAPAELVLYVTPDSAASRRARVNLAAILAAYTGQVLLEVCDVAREPDRAEADRILFTPTLVFRCDPPAWVVGDLTDREPVVSVLRAMGVEEPS